MPPKAKQSSGKKPSSGNAGGKKGGSNFDDMLAEFAKIDQKKAVVKATQETQKLASLIPSVPKFAQPPTAQTWPEPEVPVDMYIKPGTYPECHIMEYTQEFNRYRMSSKEKKEEERDLEQELQDARKGAEVHRVTRKWMQSWVKPGMKMIDICEKTEDKVRQLLQADGLDGGIGFPMGCSLNHCAAHYTPNPGDNTVLGQNDVMKIDIGVHVKGRIVDSAFTMCWNPQFQPLLNATREATEAGIKAAGIDVRLCDVGAAIQEVMESHEVEIDGKKYDVKCVKNLCGHTINRYQIHGGKSVPSYDNKNQTKMEENEFYAIETFGTTGNGMVYNDPDCSHYAKAFSAPLLQSNNQREKELLAFIDKHFGTLPWCKRYLERKGESKYGVALRHLVNAGVVTAYPPLSDIRGSYVAQFEHSFVLRPTCKEVFSKGEDY